MTTITDLSHWDKDPRVFLFTSLTAGSSHIVTATSRIETILRANKIPFQAVDTATDETAKKLWGRRAGKKKLPALVKEGYVIADLEEVEEWNEFGELKENIGPLPPAGATTVHAVQTTLGSLRMHDGAVSAPATSSAPKASTPLANAPTPASSERVATPLVPLVNASKIKPLSGAASKAPEAVSEPTSKAPEAALEPAPTQAEAQTSTPAPAAPGSSLAASDAAKPETITSSVNDKTESIHAAEEKAAPASTAASSTSSPDPIGAAASAVSAEPSIEPVAPAPEDKKHRGSSVSAVSAAEIKEAEEKNVIHEEDEAAEVDQAGVSVQD